MNIKYCLRIFSMLLALVFILTASIIHPLEINDQVRTFTRPYEFDYSSWTVNALFIKGVETSLRITSQLSEVQKRQAVDEYLQLVHDIATLEVQIDSILNNPNHTTPEQEIESYIQELKKYESRLAEIKIITEAVLQFQINSILAGMDLALADQTLPPVLFYTSGLPMQLIISPRQVIRQDASLSLLPDIELHEIIELEREVESALAISALVVPLGGVSTYPTMVIRTSDLSFLLETIAHEWIHNYLAFFPLGMHYSSSPQLRTINETVASLGGKEISQAVLRQFYADLLPPQPLTPKDYAIKTNQNKSTFDFRLEMYLTRMHVDQLLGQGRIDMAEEFMENRRKVFWDHGYTIRRLNQAYFAFHGAYADAPYGAAGEDPVGAAVRVLWEKSTSLTDFINRIRWVSTYEDLKRMVYSY